MDKTDAKLKTLERQIKSVYTKAYQEMKKEASDILAKIEVNPDMPLAQKMALMTKYDRLNTLSTQLANTAYEANSYAQKMINNEMVNIYDINYNGDAERLGFGLVDHTAIKKILKQEENPFNMISSLRDKEGIRNQMKGQLLSGLLKGEGINKIARRLKDVSEKSLKDSIRIARTETTRVQNSAKMDIGKHGQELGFEMWKRWVATTDGRVREDHLAMNGVEVPQDEPFVLPDGSKMMFPGDISMGADVSQVVNCRCTMIEFRKEVDKDGDIEENNIGLGDDYTGFSKESNNGNVGKFEDYIYKHHPEAFGEDIEQSVENAYERKFGGMEIKMQGEDAELWGYKKVSMEEWVNLPYGKQLESYPDFESYSKYVIEGKSTIYKKELLGDYAKEGSVIDGFKKFNNGATAGGYGKEKGARMLFDEQYGLSKFIDSNKDVQYNGGELFRGVSTTKSGIQDILKAIDNQETISMNGLSSWSTKDSVAKEFTELSLVKRGKCPIVFRDVTSGQRPAMPFPYSSMGISPQYEVVYSGSAEFIPIKSEIKEGVMYVDVKLKK